MARLPELQAGRDYAGTVPCVGVELARQMWGDRFQIIVTTHLDKEHLHNHFCINSVSFKDGGKYNLVR